MKAVVLYQYGGPEVLEYTECSDPAPGEGEVRIHVAATSINPFDLKLRAGVCREFLPLALPAILGVDVSGTVEEVGAGERHLLAAPHNTPAEAGKGEYV